MAHEQLPEQPGIVRRAVALGRCLQNPLAVLCSLGGSRKEVLSLQVVIITTLAL